MSMPTIAPTITRKKIVPDEAIGNFQSILEIFRKYCTNHFTEDITDGLACLTIEETADFSLLDLLLQDAAHDGEHRKIPSLVPVPRMTSHDVPVSKENEQNTPNSSSSSPASHNSPVADDGKTSSSPDKVRNMPWFDLASQADKRRISVEDLIAKFQQFKAS